MTQEEVPLQGGNVGAGVVRVGATVRRPAGPSSRAVEALLVHLENVGFEGCPCFLGYDGQGRQVLSYVEGHAGPAPSDIDRPGLVEVGRLVRGYHDAAERFVPPPGAVWDVPVRPDREELVCHHDLAPWNLVRGAGGLVFIDWDGAGPGSRRWDLAWACLGFVPLAPWGELEDDEAAGRLSALVDGYGLDGPSRLALVEVLAERALSMYRLLHRGHLSGEEPWAGLYQRGHGELWSGAARYAGGRYGLWREALGVA